MHSKSGAELLLFFETYNNHIIFLPFICIYQFFFVPLHPQRFITMDDYRFINIDQEPSEEQLAQLMHEVAVEAKERFDKARSAYFAQIHQMAQAL